MTSYPQQSEYKASIPQETVLKAVAAFPLGNPTDMRPGGGTASPKTVFRSDGDVYLLRRRRSEFCPENRVRFDHGFVRHLAEAGLPVASPLVARDGRTWVVDGGHTYEIVPFIEGLAIGRLNSASQMVAAASMLGRLHRASRSFSPPTEKDLGRDLYLPRYLHLLEEQLDARRTHDASLRDVGQRMLEMAKEVVVDVERARPDDLSPLAVHGDYMPGNVMFRADEVGGIFDFDWATMTSRVWDVARGILHFAFRRRTRLNPDEITSLTEAMTPDLDRASSFLSAYTAAMPALSAQEEEILPLFIREALLCMRIGGMRKVPVERRLAYATEGMEPLLDWIETSVESFVSRLTAGA